MIFKSIAFERKKHILQKKNSIINRPGYNSALNMSYMTY